MNSVTKFAFVAFLIPIYALCENTFENLLKNHINKNGYLPPSELNPPINNDLAQAGEVIFESNHISLTSDISCVTCHLPDHGATDGLPVSAAIGGEGEGKERLLSGGKLLARNALSLSGRGAKHFEAFFWDGKVVNTKDGIISQFGNNLPSDDPFVVAIHLPVVEIREMVDENEFIVKHKLENVEAAYEVYDRIAANLIENEPVASEKIADIAGVNMEKLEYRHYASAIAAFIRDEFPIKETKLSDFMAGEYEFTTEELKGGLLFYGKGGCVSCHSGPHFSDFKFYSIPFPQLGFGKSGFGVDYGRYSATFDPKDIYKFRTPPLWDVVNTEPYGHSGSVNALKDAVTVHFDPFGVIDLDDLDSFQRHELYKRIATSNECASVCSFLEPDEVELIVKFLDTLTFR